MEILIGAYVIFVVPWLIAGWFRTPRYAQCLNDAQYDTSAYLRWVMTQKAEKRYLHLFVTLLVIFAIISCCGSIYLPRIIYNSPVASSMINLGVLLLAVTFAPHGLSQKKTFSVSWHKIRLIIIGFFIHLLPTIASLGIIGSIYASISDPKNSPESMILAFGFLTLILLLIMITGPLTFIFTPYAILIANLINRIFELIIPKYARTS